jgi:hypothetical protein
MDEIVTIQQTSKTWKGLWLLSLVVAGVGFFLPAPYGGLLILVALVLAVGSRIGRWWHHA